MIAYKWVIKCGNKYHPIINNGAYPPAKNINLPHYKKGKTIKHFIDINTIIEPRSKFGFHREGFHFWKKPEDKNLVWRYQKCMKDVSNKNFNCILKCYIRNKDVIMENSYRLIAKKFRILGEYK